MDNSQERIDEAKKFFDLIFGNVHEPKFSYLCTIDNKIFGKSLPFDVSDADARHLMAIRAIEINDAGHNVYFAVNCSDEPPTDEKRGDAKKITMQTATPTDIDCEGGTHTSGNVKKYPPDFDTAKSLLPFEISLLVNSGYGLQGYAIYSEPIKITADNREIAHNRNKKFIEAIRTRAGDYKSTVDGVGDLARVMRVPGTRNYKLGICDDAPLCHIVEVNDLRFIPEQLDEKLNALAPSIPKTNSETTKKHVIQTKSARKTDKYSVFNDDAEYILFSAKRMLDVFKKVNHKDLSYARWLAINTACKNIGVPYEIVDEFNRSPNNAGNYNAEQNAKMWQKLEISPNYTIETLAGIARDFGYREEETQREYVRKFYFGNDCSDLANARRLERFCKGCVRWLEDDEHWLIWKNGIWKRSSEKNSILLPMTSRLYDFLQPFAKNKDDFKIINNFQRIDKVNKAVTYLKGRESILITAADLDQHPNLINAKNGVVDLQTGLLYPHVDYRDKMITQQVRADFNPNAQSDLVDKFFVDIMPDEETRRGLLRWLGYCITGENSEEKFLIWIGRGSNGKGVLGGSCLELFGDYGTGLNQRALLRNGTFAADPSKPSTELNCLERRRFALSEELPLKAELNVELVKNLTGGDRLPIRKLYREECTIRNFAKINISGNFKPSLENIDDDGLRRRLLNMPFLVKFGNGGKPIDFDLKRKIIQPENLSALFTILVREAVTWYSGEGLIVSDLMTEETNRHFDANNFVDEFISEKFVRVDSASVRAKDFVDELKRDYPAECANFKRDDLIRHICHVGRVEYTTDKCGNYRIFKGIGKRGNDFDTATPISSDDIPPPTDD